MRVIANHSSGKMGYAVAEAARDRGAEVSIVSAPTALPDPFGIKVVSVRTALQMHDALHKECADADALVMAAAVADWRPSDISDQKVKKGATDTWQVELIKNPDIIAGITYEKLVKVGFAAESEDLVANAESKLLGKGLHLIAANDITDEDSGFGVDTNKVVLLDREGGQEALPLMSKYDVGCAILDRVVGYLY